MTKYHSDGDAPPEGNIFVFGSNLSGAHWGGAARYARDFKGAGWSVSEGRTGESYAIPTMGFNACAPLSLSDVRLGVEEFLDHAEEHPDRVFFVTRIGCGIAGFTDADIAPLFHNAPENCDLPINWRI
jgi:hypothetical protein